MLTPADALAKSPTLAAAARHTIAFCVENRITDLDEISEIMDRAVVRIHAELDTFVNDVLSGKRPEVVEALMLHTYVGIRDEKGLDVPADVRERAERFGYKRLG